MKQFSPSKYLASVQTLLFILLFSVNSKGGAENRSIFGNTSPAQAQLQNATTESGFGQAYERVESQRITEQAKLRCSEIRAKYVSAKAEAVAACQKPLVSFVDEKPTDKKNPAPFCKKKINECLSVTEAEHDLDINSVMQNSGVPMPKEMLPFTSSLDFSDPEIKCPDMTYKDYKSELKEATEELSKAQKDLNEKKKELLTSTSDFSKKKNEKIKELREMAEKQKEAEYKSKEDDRKEEMEAAKALAENDRALNQRSLEITQLEGKKVTLTAARSMQVNKYQDKIFECEIQAKEFKANLLKHNIGSLRMGSFKELSAKGTGMNERIRLKYENCVKDVLALRNAEAKAYQQEVSTLNSQIQAANKDIENIRNAIKTADAQRAQQKSDKLNKKQEDLKAYNERYQDTVKEILEYSQQVQAEQAQINGTITEANSKVTRASNSLKTTSQQKMITTSKTPSEVIGLIEKADGALSEFKGQCCSTLGPSEFRADSLCREYFGEEDLSSSDEDGTK